MEFDLEVFVKHFVKAGLLAALAIFAVTLCVSCSNPIEAFNKLEINTFLKNTTDQKVIITFTHYGTDYEYVVEAKSSLEIPDNIQYGLRQDPDGVGTVTFTFGDGTSYTHTCEADHPEALEHKDKYKFTPAENNILDQDIDDTGSWVKTSAGENNHYNMTYYIK